jgi:hypothetical protein
MEYIGHGALAPATAQTDLVQTLETREFCTTIDARLRKGAHLLLYGPRGVGKSSLIRTLASHYHSIAIPCGMVAETSGLPAVVAALAAAYPDTDLAGIGKRAARARLHRAADHTSGILLLDHATTMTAPMLGFLRRLRGGIAGVLLVVDVDSARERERIREWHAGMLSVRMPRLSYRTLHKLLLAKMKAPGVSTIESPMVRHILRRADGRVGWLSECVLRLQKPAYWEGTRLRLAALCMDTELALRDSRGGPLARR